MKEKASKILLYNPVNIEFDKEEILKDLENALLASKIMAYAQVLHY